MFNKIVHTREAALAGIPSGATILLPGFGGAGRPDWLLEGINEANSDALTIVSNNAGRSDDILGQLVASGRVKKVVCSFPRSGEADSPIVAAWRNGQVDVELVPQGTLAERIRAGGSGIGAFFTPTAAETELAEGKESRIIDGVRQVLEYAITADIALGHAEYADRWGNLAYRRAARNFNPIMLPAGSLSIVEATHISSAPLDPERVGTPGIFVDRVVQIGVVG